MKKKKKHNKLACLIYYSPCFVFVLLSGYMCYWLSYGIGWIILHFFGGTSYDHSYFQEGNMHVTDMEWQVPYGCNDLGPCFQFGPREYWAPTGWQLSLIGFITALVIAAIVYYSRKTWLWAKENC